MFLVLLPLKKLTYFTPPKARLPISNRFAPLSGKFWGDEEDEATIENWETVANTNYNAISDLPIQCTEHEQERGSFTLTSSSTNSEDNMLVASPDSPPSTHYDDPDYQPTPSNTKKKLVESDYLPPNFFNQMVFRPAIAQLD
ncbi:hypothetical protein LguiA_025566 [Lonicera macranthoides]